MHNEPTATSICNKIIDIDRIPDPHAWIQWKGTNVCMDVHCSCGESGHIDAEFAYYYRCAHCGRGYAVGSSVRLWPLSAAECAVVESETCGFVQDDNMGLRDAQPAITQPPSKGSLRPQVETRYLKFDELNVVYAAREGKRIERRERTGGVWHTFPAGDAWDFVLFEYRVATEPRRIRVLEGATRLWVDTNPDSYRGVEFVEVLL
jgi:hypothetical protein